MIVAEVRAIPVGAGASMQKTVDAVKEALDDCEVDYEVGPVGTTFRVENTDDIWETMKCCQEAAMETAPRVLFTMTVDQETEGTKRGRSASGARAESRGGDGRSRTETSTREKRAAGRAWSPSAKR